MGADLSRMRFDPLRDLAGVVLQQGRLLLDADWNELVAIVDRRLRASVADLDSPGPQPGVSGVAVVPRTTPDAFKVSLAGGKLTLGRGRMYVDGLLAENHGTGKPTFDPLLAEAQRDTDTNYAKQPYGPVPDLPTAGTHLAYLDVWQREVTHVEDAGLVDVAIGVDTTARTQTAWQVRLHPITEGSPVACGTADADIPGWADLIAPSPARLSVVADPATVDTNPCDLPPSGGYRGRENQTYRVEIHDGGPAGTATLKWSRDNASVVSPVVDVAADGLSLRPASLGRDAILGFDKGDWVEVLDDHREFQREPGDMRKVDDVVDGRLVFTAALDADLRLSATAADERHLRVRRWDQNGIVRTSAGATVVDLTPATAAGVIPVPTGASTRVVLESGVTVSLTAGGASFRPGEHWLFAARAADASVEELVAAPPVGPHHHYARLGVVTFPDTESDCRTLWPPECECEGGGCSDCTVCVTPESHKSGTPSIQDAIDLVAHAGGTVCLAAGTYDLDEGGVVVEGARSVTIRGQGPATVLVCHGRGVQVTGSAAVTVEDLTVMRRGPTDPCVDVTRTAAVTLQRLLLLVLDEQNQDMPAPALALGGVSLRTRVSDNVIIAPVGIANAADEKRALLTADLEISRNLLACRRRGIVLAGQVGHLLGYRVADNEVLLAAEVGLRLLGVVGPGQVAAVRGNTVAGAGAGIEVGGGGYDVSGNTVSGPKEQGDLRPDGLAVLAATGVQVRGHTRLTGNRVRDVGGVGILVEAPLTGLDIDHNTVERALAGIVVAGRARSVVARVGHNTVLDVAGRQFDPDRVVGIQVVGAGRVDLEANVVRGVGQSPDAQGGATGIRVHSCPEVRVDGNSVDQIGPAEVAKGDLGIAVQGLVDRILVADNHVRRLGDDVNEGVGEWTGLLIDAGATKEVSRAGTYQTAVGFNAALTFGKQAAYVALSRGSAVTLDGNIVGGYLSTEPVIRVAATGTVIANGNHALKNTDLDGRAALQVEAGAVTVNGNRAAGGRPAAISLDVNPERAAVLGNVVNTDLIELAGQQLGDPWVRLNVYNAY